MRLTLLSRASDLARLQALLVGRALEARWPDLQVEYLARAASGDRDTTTPLASMPDKGAFTADLSDALLSGQADAVVHSWKDLPLETRPGSVIAATLERADPRDVLLVRRDAIPAEPALLRVLSSSPRRSWLLDQSLPGLLPWPVERVACSPVRGNVPTRLGKLLGGDAHAIVVAKAALDRLLGFGPPFEATARTVRAALDECRWIVLPLREVPGAPAQGALAIEARADRLEVIDRLRAISHQPTWDAVAAEREVLADWGGGCHEALGATAIVTAHGRVLSVRGRSAAGRREEKWALAHAGVPPRAPIDRVWPRPEERQRARRRSLDVDPPADDRGYFVARADALPERWKVSPDRLVWASGTRTWRRLAARGIWVHGCADGLGDAVPSGVDILAGRPVTWHRLTHSAAADGPDNLATYVVDERLPDDLPARTHFFWTSGSQFLEAAARWPEIRQGWHGCGPGRTSAVVMSTLGQTGRVHVWLDYDDWHREVIAPS